MSASLADARDLDVAIQHLTQGELVAFPTETVYGLGADARNARAVAELYARKGRPQFNPLICHVASLDQARQIGLFNPSAALLANTFWPGPLTLVVPRRAECSVAPLACAGLPTIAIRVPNHPLAQALLQGCDFPIAAPSANRSGRLSPTSADHVREDFPDIHLLDGGRCTIGLESSVIGCLDDAPMWLRAGGIARADIERVLGRTLSLPPQEAEHQAKLAPGRLARHYAPAHQLVITDLPAAPSDALIYMGQKLAQHEGPSFNLSASENLAEAASNLYEALHQMDRQLTQPHARIIVRPIHDAGLGEAIMDRLQRAQVSHAQ